MLSENFKPNSLVYRAFPLFYSCDIFKTIQLDDKTSHSGDPGIILKSFKFPAICVKEGSIASKSRPQAQNNRDLQNSLADQNLYERNPKK